MGQFLNTMLMYQQTLERLKKHAELDHPHPQYKGHFDRFRLALVAKNSPRYKGGSRFLKGDYVIAADLRYESESGNIEIYDPVTGHICIWDAAYIQWLTSGE